MSYAAKIEVLNTAIVAIAACQKAGRVTAKALEPIAAAIALGIAPPIVLPGRQPLMLEGVKAAPGSWPQFARALVNCESQQLDMAKLREGAKTDERDGRRANFFNYVMTAVHGALTSSLNRAKALQEEDGRRSRAREEARKRREAEENSPENQARKAARTALEAAAAGQTAAPKVRQPRPAGKPRAQQPQERRHPRLTADRIRSLIASVKAQRERDGIVGSEAGLSAARFVCKLVLEAEKNTSYTRNEIELFKSEIKAFVQNVYFAQSSKLAEAEREAANWLARAEGFARRQDNAPKQGTPAAARPTVPSQKKAEPRATPNAEGGIMAQAMVRAGLGKAANG